jgi:hypothetical protein
MTRQVFWLHKGGRTGPLSQVRATILTQSYGNFGLEDQALAAAGELAALADPGADLDAAYMHGIFGWFRFQGSGEDAGRGWLVAAILFLAHVFTADADAVPEPLRREANHRP